MFRSFLVEEDTHVAEKNTTGISTSTFHVVVDSDGLSENRALFWFGEK